MIGVLPLLGILTVLSFSTTARPPDPDRDRLPVVASSERAFFDTLQAVSRHVFRETNAVRRERALPPLRKESRLAEVACAHSADMFRRSFFEHVNPDGESPHDRVAHMHRRLVGGVSENLYGQDRVRKEPAALADQMVERWMGSPPHRKNILSPPSTHLGVCVLQRGTELRATQVFAKIVGYLTPPLPRKATPGSVLAVSFEGPAPPNVARYDFWDPRTDRRISRPSLFTDSLRIPDTTGTVRPRFYTVGAGKYVIYQGPELTVADAPKSPSR
jgi:uncharacterized protein YkwD